MISYLMSLWTVWRFKRKYKKDYPIADPNGAMCGLIDVTTGETIWTHHKPDLQLEEAVLGTRKLLKRLEEKGI
jgi:hypothetical protein